VAVNLG